MTEENQNNFDEMTIAELRERASQLEITGRSSMNKTELLQSVKDAAEQVSMLQSNGAGNGSSARVAVEDPGDEWRPRGYEFSGTGWSKGNGNGSTQTESESEGNPRSQDTDKTEAKAESESNGGYDAHAEPQKNGESDAQAEPQTNGESDAQAEPEANGGSGGDGDSGGDDGPGGNGGGNDGPEGNGGSGDDADREESSGEEDASDITAPSIGPNTTIEHVPPEERLDLDKISDVDAMGLDKRRQVGGQRYGASPAKQAAVYGGALALIVAAVIGAKLLTDELDQPPAVQADTAPWAEGKQRPPAPIDFPRSTEQ